MRSLPLALLAALLAACAGAPPSGASPEDGAALYRSKCSACHRPYPPEDRTRAQWAEALSRMAPRAHLGDRDRARLLGWLVAHAKDGAAGGGR